jgi:hypothetical protein
MADQPEPDPPQYAARGIAGLVVANSSLILAILIYMGWAYDNALFGYFHLSTLDLGFGPLEYALRSLNLFSPDIVIAAVVLTAIMSVRGRGRSGTVIAAVAGLLAVGPFRSRPLGQASGQGDAGRPRAARPKLAVPGQHAGRLTRRSRTLMAGAGGLLTIIGLALYWSATHVRISTFLVLAVLGAGPLLLTWPTHAERRGRGPYAFALVIAALCVLWAGSVYAEQKGTQAARNLVSDLPTRTAVVVYSTQQLALSGPGLSVEHLSDGSPYHYQYTGLRLLLVQSGTYYLLPVDWTPQLSFTYIVNESSQVRIDLY